MIYGALSTVLMLALSAIILRAQDSPIYDLSQAQPWRTVWKVVIGTNGGGEVGAPHYMPDLCGLDGHHLLSIGAPGGGRQFMTYPRIDTNAPPPKGWGAGYIPIDYDGVQPLEYSDDNGRINRCLGGPDPWVRERIDTISCWAPTIVADFSVDVDGDGYLDVVCDIGGGGMAFRVISGGPQAGKGCERTTSFDVPSPGSEIDWIYALYRSVNGQWRMIHNTIDEGNEYLILYEVRFTRTSPRGDGLHASFEAIDTLYTQPHDIGKPSTFGNSVVVQDTILKRDFLVLSYKPVFQKVVAERFDITDGEFKASGDKVVGLGMEWDDRLNFSLGHQLHTPYPVFVASTVDGLWLLFFNVYDLVHPIAVWRGAESGVIPIGGHAVINDQTGDGVPDMVWSGGNPARVSLQTLDSSIVSVEEQDTNISDYRADMLGTLLRVRADRACEITIDIAAIDGRTLYSAPPTTIDTGEYRQDLLSVLQQLVSGAYFVRVRCGANVTTLPIMHVHQ